MTTLPVFSPAEREIAKRVLATTVGQMMGRKFEEGDWARVYCQAKSIPERGWSNLNIDIMHRGLGVEHKMMRRPGVPIRDACGVTLMHPAATRSIRIEDSSADPDEVMRHVFEQYTELISLRTSTVARETGVAEPDMRIGWLLWETSLTEFLYFEEPMVAPIAEDYRAVWNTTEARGARKASTSLWVYNKATGEKRYSVTTSAGVKIQPYFDVPHPSDPNLEYFRVQGEPINGAFVLVWLSPATIATLTTILGQEIFSSADRLSDAITNLAAEAAGCSEPSPNGPDLAVPIRITKEAYLALTNHWGGVSDEHRAQLFAKSLLQNTRLETMREI